MLSEYQTQNTLNPKLWIGVTLKPKLHESFMKIATHFYDFLEIDAPDASFLYVQYHQFLLLGILRAAL